MKLMSWLVLSGLVLSSASFSADSMGGNKERDLISSYPFNTEETVKIGIALAEIGVAILLPSGRTHAVVNDERILALKTAKDELEAANKLVTKTSHMEMLAKAEQT